MTHSAYHVFIPLTSLKSRISDKNSVFRNKVIFCTFFLSGMELTLFWIRELVELHFQNHFPKLDNSELFWEMCLITVLACSTLFCTRDVLRSILRRYYRSIYCNEYVPNCMLHSIGYISYVIEDLEDVVRCMNGIIVFKLGSWKS